jgi:DNA repair protein RecO (recombination protein O)
MSMRHDRVLLLRRTPFGESSLVVQGLARGVGRVHLLAKGAHRVSSRFAHVLDLLDTLDLAWHARPGQELGTLAAGELGVRRRHISASVGAWRAATTALELVELAARPGEPEPALFDRLSMCLDRLEAGAPPELTLLVFEVGYLDTLGLAPALVACAVCGLAGDEAHPGRAAFSAGAGGRLCLAHAAEARASGRRVGTLPTDVLVFAARAASEPFPGLVAAAPGVELVARARDFVGRFLDYHLEARPKSQRSFLAAPDRNRRSDHNRGVDRS